MMRTDIKYGFYFSKRLNIYAYSKRKRAELPMLQGSARKINDSTDKHPFLDVRNGIELQKDQPLRAQHPWNRIPISADK